MQSLDLRRVRAEFPALASGFVYFDNAGGSQTLARVADRVRDYLLSTNVQLGASYAISQRSGERVAEGYRVAAALMGTAEPREIVLGSSTTQLLANLALAMRSQFRPGDEIVVSRAEHESNAGPWSRLAASTGVVVKGWPVDRETLRLEPRDLERILTPKTRLVAFTHVSNILGSIHDVTAITRVAHRRGARVMVDGVAYAPHRAIDVRNWDVDYYAFSFYKVFGPHIAALYGKRELLEALDVINHGFIPKNEVPYKLQPGNANFELSHGLGGIVEYLDALGGKEAAFDAIAAHEESLAAPLLAFLREARGVRVWGEPSADRAKRVPTIGFTVEGKSPESVVRAVDPHGIGIRHGDFYAKHLAEDLGIAAKGAVVRVSMVHYNTHEEVERLIRALAPAIGA